MMRVIEKMPPVSAVLSGWKLNAARLARMLGVAHGTGARYLADDGLIRVRDLRKLAASGIDAADLASAIFGMKLERRGGVE